MLTGCLAGMRCPDLQNGGDAQFGMMKEAGFLYDASLPSIAFGYTNMANGLWPYSLDYLSIQVQKDTTHINDWCVSNP